MGYLLGNSGRLNKRTRGRFPGNCCGALLFIWVRGTLPRFRYDQLMAFGWKFLLPLAMVNIVITSLVYALHSYLRR